MKPTLVQRIGGRRSVSLATWAWMAPVSVLGFSLTVNLVGRESSLLDVMRAAGISHLVAGLAMLIVRYTYLRPAEPTVKRFWLTILSYPIFGAAGGASYVWQLYSLGLVEQAESVERIATRAWITLVWNVITTLLLDENDRYLKISQELAAELKAQDELVNAKANLVNQVRADMVDSVRATLDSALRNVDPKGLNRVATEIVGPLYQRLSKESTFHLSRSKAQAKKPSLVPLISRAFTGIGNPVVIGIGAVAGSLANSIRQRGTFGLVATIVVALLIMAAVLLLKALAQKGKFIQIAAAVVVILVILTAAFSLDLAYGEPSYLLVSAAAGNVLVAIFLILFFSLQSLRSEQISQLNEARALNKWSEEKLRQQLWAESRRLAKFIHAEIQGRIRAAASSGETLSTEKLRALRETCTELLNEALGKTSFGDFVEQTNNFWGEIVEIQWEIAQEAKQALVGDSFSELAVIEALRDALVNAVRHGKASKVVARVSLVQAGGGPEVRISLWNNGRKLRPDSRDGFGGEVFSEVTSRWTLENRNEGVEFLAYVPVAVTSEFFSAPPGSRENLNSKA